MLDITTEHITARKSLTGTNYSYGSRQMLGDLFFKRSHTSGLLGSTRVYSAVWGYLDNHVMALYTSLGKLKY